MSVSCTVSDLLQLVKHTRSLVTWMMNVTVTSIKICRHCMRNFDHRSWLLLLQMWATFTSVSQTSYQPSCKITIRSRLSTMMPTSVLHFPNYWSQKSFKWLQWLSLARKATGKIGKGPRTGNYGWSGVTQGHRQCDHSIDYIWLPIHLP